MDESSQYGNHFLVWLKSHHNLYHLVEDKFDQLNASIY